MVRPGRRRAAVALPDGHFVVPGNRWDLLGGMSAEGPPSVSVVIPHFNAPRQLDRILLALSHQSYPLSRVEVIVADDGSDELPTAPAPTDLRVRVVGQADAGFRAAAARNLGAAAAAGEVLCFLDVDTVPEPGYLQALVRMPALSPDMVVTGRRRHADLSAMTGEEFAEWLWGSGPGPKELPEPQWLRDRHEKSGDLLRLDPDAYRFVLSAVLCCSRSLFLELGGFDETFVRYGGEDSEIAHRALCAGAVLAHVSDAVAWHDGASWAERGDAESRRAEKNAETLTLSRLIPDPQFGPRPWTGRPDVVVELETDDQDPAAVALAVQSVLAGAVDAGVWLQGSVGRAVKDELFAFDPRVAAGPVCDQAVASARVWASCSRPLRVDIDSWPALIARLAPSSSGTALGQLVLDTGNGVLTLSATRAVARQRRWSAMLPEHDLVEELFGRESLSASENGVSAIEDRPDLAHELARLSERRRPTR